MGTRLLTAEQIKRIEQYPEAILLADLTTIDREKSGILSYALTMLTQGNLQQFLRKFELGNGYEQ